MIQNSKVITENEFMQKRKIILLRAVATLKRLGGHESLIEELVEKARRNNESMLDGLLEKLTELQSGYREKSSAYCRLQEIIDEIEGGC